jgi:hypothetical protein
MDELSMLVTLSFDGVDDSVRRVHLDSSLGNVSDEVCHVVVNDDVGFMWMGVGMVGMACWEAFSSFSFA